jgi:hypothetical protein
MSDRINWINRIVSDQANKDPVNPVILSKIMYFHTRREGAEGRYF